jgi:hypothetical protein
MNAKAKWTPCWGASQTNRQTNSQVRVFCITTAGGSDPLDANSTPFLCPIRPHPIISRAAGWQEWRDGGATAQRHASCSVHRAFVHSCGVRVPTQLASLVLEAGSLCNRNRSHPGPGAAGLTSVCVYYRAGCRFCISAFWVAGSWVLGFGVLVAGFWFLVPDCGAECLKMYLGACRFTCIYTCVPCICICMCLVGVYVSSRYVACWHVGGQ